MAEAVVGERRSPPTRFYCHMCNLEINIFNNDYTCPLCSGGFIEELPLIPGGDGNSTAGGSGSNTNIALVAALKNLISNDADGGGGETSTGSSGIRSNSGSRRSVIGASGGGGNGGVDGRQRQLNLHKLDNVFLEFLSSLSSGKDGVLGNSQMGNPGDYAWGREVIDTVTQLLNHIDTSEPPPLPKEKIAEIPIVAITETEVEQKLKCSVCLEDFKLQEAVRKLPCLHVYHEHCIMPWLDLHGTCPICQKSLQIEPSTSGGGGGETSTGSSGNRSNTGSRRSVVGASGGGGNDGVGGRQLSSGEDGENVCRRNVADLIQRLNRGFDVLPLPKEKIAEIPIVAIAETEVEQKLKCSVCLEDFKLQEAVRKLPCLHVYHKHCIMPWLDLHGTCPICQKSLQIEPSTSGGGGGETSTGSSGNRSNTGSRRSVVGASGGGGNDGVGGRQLSSGEDGVLGNSQMGNPGDYAWGREGIDSQPDSPSSRINDLVATSLMTCGGLAPMIGSISGGPQELEISIDAGRGGCETSTGSNGSRSNTGSRRSVVGTSGGGSNGGVGGRQLSSGEDGENVCRRNRADFIQRLNRMFGVLPLPKKKIVEIPFVAIAETEVEQKLKCSVCLEDFKLQEAVRKLPCLHVYHKHCIMPWLDLHGTCPICQKSLQIEPSGGGGGETSTGSSGSRSNTGSRRSVVGASGGGGNDGVGGRQLSSGEDGENVCRRNVADLIQRLNRGFDVLPLPKEKIAEIPIVAIAETEVEQKLKCSVCLEDFKLQEAVRKLPCLHVYHKHCIMPWLDLHGTCPICQKSLQIEPSTSGGGGGETSTGSSGSRSNTGSRRSVVGASGGGGNDGVGGRQLSSGEDGENVCRRNVADLIQRLNRGFDVLPLPKEKIAEIPIVAIAETEVEQKLKCSVCLEDFKLQEAVRKLPCLHVYHEHCIMPWLGLRRTCPICRKSLL